MARDRGQVGEAHPEDAGQVGINHAKGVVYDQPTSSAARAAIAAECVVAEKIRIPVAINNTENTISEAYSAWPERPYLIDVEVIIRHRSDMGPFTMKAVEAWHCALWG